MTLVAPSSLQGATIEVVVPGLRLEISGRLDASSVHRVRRAVDDAIGLGDGDLVLDVRLAEIRDSAGLGVFVGAHRRAAAGGRRLVLLHPSERFERLVRGARLSRILARVP